MSLRQNLLVFRMAWRGSTVVSCLISGRPGRGELVEEDERAAPADAVAPDVIAALAAPEADDVETPEAFLTGVSFALKASDDVDADLAAILSDHLLTVTPHDNVIANAKTAILALAAERAAPDEEQADG